MILVTGATGNVGGEILRGLLERDLPTRAATSDPAHARAILPGSSVKHFNFNDPKTFDAALEGVRRVFLMRPPAMGDARAFQPFLEALKTANLEQVVFLSLLGAQTNPIVPHRKIELALERLEIPYIFLRPSFFLQNLSGIHRSDILERSDLFIPAGNGRTSFIDARDVAAVAVHILSAPHLTSGGVDLTGAEALSYLEVAEIFSEVLGREIHYSNPMPPKFGLEMQRRGIKPELINAMILIYNVNRFGWAARVTGDVRRILGREPLSVREFVEDFKPLFSSYS